MSTTVEAAASLVHPNQPEVQKFSSCAMVVDVHSPHEYAEDQVPGAVNLPVVVEVDVEYAEIGTKHKAQGRQARGLPDHLIAVDYSLRNIAAQINPEVHARRTASSSTASAAARKNYRRWVHAGPGTRPSAFSYRVLCGSSRLSKFGKQRHGGMPCM